MRFPDNFLPGQAIDDEVEGKLTDADRNVAIQVHLHLAGVALATDHIAVVRPSDDGEVHLVKMPNQTPESEGAAKPSEAFELQIPNAFVRHSARRRVRELMVAAHEVSGGSTQQCAQSVGYALDTLDEAMMPGVLGGRAKLTTGPCP